MLKYLLLSLLMVAGLAWAKPVYLTGYEDRPILETFASKPTENLVIVLHAVKTSASFMKVYYPLGQYVDRYKFNLVIPSGSKNKKGQRYWNAGKACCDFYKEGADDLKYLDQLIAHYKTKLGSKRIFLIGHSNGAFMANHYACHGKETIGGFFSYAGNPSPSLKDCRPFTNLTAIHAHGRKDSYVPFDGGELKQGGHFSLPVASYLTAYETKMGCSPLLEIKKTNYMLNSLGKDVTIKESKTCEHGNRLIFWDYDGGHVPRFHNRYFRSMLEELFGNGK